MHIRALGQILTLCSRSVVALWWFSFYRFCRVVGNPVSEKRLIIALLFYCPSLFFLFWLRWFLFVWLFLFFQIVEHPTEQVLACPVFLERRRSPWLHSWQLVHVVAWRTPSGFKLVWELFVRLAQGHIGMWNRCWHLQPYRNCLQKDGKLKFRQMMWHVIQ